MIPNTQSKQPVIPNAASEHPSEQIQKREAASHACIAIQKSLGVTVTYDSETLPVVDHYLRETPSQEAMQDLCIYTVGSYLGEVIKKQLSATWMPIASAPSADSQDTTPANSQTLGSDDSHLLWKLTLPSGISINPYTAVRSCLQRVSYDYLLVPRPLKALTEQLLERMGSVSEDMYFSTSNQFDVLEHLHTSLMVAKEQATEANNKATTSPSPGQ